MFTNDDPLNATNPLGLDEEDVTGFGIPIVSTPQPADYATTKPSEESAKFWEEQARNIQELSTPDSSDEAMKHILEEHGPGTEGNGKGTFARGMSTGDIHTMINDTIENGAPRSNTLGRSGQIIEKTYSSLIGSNGAGEASSSLRVVINSVRKLVTGFPY